MMELTGRCLECVEWNRTYDRSAFCRKCPDYERIAEERRGYGGVPFFAPKVHIAGYGNASVSRVKELERRSILPYDVDGGYVVGRRGDNGKVQEKEQDLTP